MPGGSTSRPAHDREAQLEEFHRVYTNALQLIGKNTFSSEDAAEFVRNATDGMASVLKQLANAEAGLQTFIEECPPEHLTLLSRSTKLLKDIADIEHKAQQIQRHFLNAPT